MIFLGIDTSNYTTSVALCGGDGSLRGAAKLLPVGEGEKGLRQSEALFSHVKALPSLCEEIGDLKGLEAVGASGFPRRAENSYMPCFLAGASLAASTAAFFGVPLYIFSHQEGHAAAAIRGSGMTPEDSFFVLHLSGGTLDLLRAEKKDFFFDLERVGGGADITCGQLVDRCGVKLGLKFPCGGELEKLALRSDRTFDVKIPKKDGLVNLSGLENRFDRLVSESLSKEDLAKFVFDAVVSAVRALTEDVGGQLLFSGGVASSQLLREAFKDREKTYFCPGEYSRDNALGTALLAKAAFEAGAAPDGRDRLRM
ncbi:MAG: hypothetical protein IJV00_07285 [Clostridia bacterium]|nr:hypothetical protein [Clostridia bacterium]